MPFSNIISEISKGVRRFLFFFGLSLQYRASSPSTTSVGAVLVGLDALCRRLRGFCGLGELLWPSVEVFCFGGLDGPGSLKHRHLPL